MFAPNNELNNPKFRFVSPNVTLPPVAVAVAVPPLIYCICVLTGSCGVDVVGSTGFNTNLPLVIKLLGIIESGVLIFTLNFVKWIFEDRS